MVPMPMAMYPINNTSRKFKESATEVDRMILKDVVSLCMSMKRCVTRESGLLNTGKRLEGLFFVDWSASFRNFEALLSRIKNLLDLAQGFVILPFPF